MDKKNTMLLTVIAVATLLVAVVGATFAYFTATGTVTSDTTVVTATTEKVAAVTLEAVNPTLTATLTAKEFAQSTDAYVKYWATLPGVDAPAYDPSEELRSILRAAVNVGTDTSTTAKYECTATLLVEVEGAELQKGDAYIKFGGQLASVSQADEDGYIDITDIPATGYDITFNLDAGQTTEQFVTAAVAIANRDANQDHLAGKTIDITLRTVSSAESSAEGPLKNKAFACQVVE